jgi:4'-phosphopantetheinyl transferase
MKIYISNINKCKTTVLELEKKLPFDLLAQAKKYKNYLDYRRSLIAYNMLYVIGRQDFGLTENFKIKNNEYGKPYLFHRENYFFNISHSEDWVALAISTKEIGIDLEFNLCFEYSEVTDFIFTQKEREFFEKVSTDMKNRVFYRFWTLKESYIKAIGTGMSKKLDSFTIELWNEKIQVEGNEDFNFLELPFHKNYTLSVCYSESDSLDCVEVIKF